MSIFGLFSGKNRSVHIWAGTETRDDQPSKLNQILMMQLADIESRLENGSNFHGVFLDEDRDALERACIMKSSSVAFINLALIYSYGVNVARDYKKAESLLLNAVSMGNPLAYKYLALIEEEIKDDAVTAAQYLKAGSKRGDEGAMVSLGVAYMQGSHPLEDRGRLHSDRGSASRVPTAITLQ